MKTWQEEFEETFDPILLLKNQSGDADKWARSFVDTMKKIGKDEMDVDLMRSWFANAIMSHHDFLYNTKIKDLEERNSKLISLMLLADPVVSNVVVSDLQLNQWNEYIRCYPDDKFIIRES